MRTIRIVVVSSSDVQDERVAVRRVAEEVNDIIQSVRADLSIELIICGNNGVMGAVPTEVTREKIDPDLEVLNADIVIGIFWRAFEKPLLNAASDPEHQIRLAYTVRQQSRRPDIWLYFNSAPAAPRTSQEAEQWVRVLKFKEDVSEHGSVREYNGPGDFERTLLFDLIGVVVQEPSRTDDSMARPDDEITFTVETTPALAAAEGFTERTGDIVLKFRVPARFIGRETFLTIRVFFNTSVSNRLLIGRVTDSVISTESGKVLAKGKVSGNELLFESIPIVCSRADRATSLTIKNMLVNANGIADPGKIYASVVAEGETRIAPPKEPVLVGIVNRVLSFVVLQTRPPVLRRSEPAPPTAIASLQFAERFAGAFRYRNETMIGTRLKAVFSVPKGVRLFVATTPLGIPAHATLIASEAGRADVVSPIFHMAGVPVAEVSTTSWLRYATWELNIPAQSGLLYEFPVFVAYDTNSQADLQESGLGSVGGSLAPNPTMGAFSASQAAVPSPTMPVPRYADTSMMHAFFEIIP
jgi:hypothetical protein